MRGIVSRIIESAKSDPKTTWAAVASFLAAVGGLFGTVESGRVWPIVLGIVCSKLADVIHGALAADAASVGKAQGIALSLPIGAQIDGKTDPKSIARRVLAWRKRFGLLAAVFLVCLVPGSALAVTTITGVAGTSVLGAASAPSAGDFITGSSIQVPMQSIENDIATIAGGTWTSTATETFSGAITFSSTSYLRLVGREIRRASAAMPHNGTLHTAFFVDIATGNEYRYDSGSPSPNDNYLKIREGTSSVPGGLQSGDWIRFTTGPNVAGGQAYTIYREDGTTQLAELWGGGQWVEFMWNGSQWRYVSSAPWVPNGTSFPSPNPYYNDTIGNYGVVLYPSNL